MTHHTHIAPLDLRPTGHLPFLVEAVEATRKRANQLAAAPVDCINCGRNLDDTDAKQPYGAGIVGDNGQPLMTCAPTCQTTDGPFTAAQRGTTWMARYGCNPECQMDHAGTDGEPGWHATALVETALRDHQVDADPDPYGPEIPWLAAQVVVFNDRPQAYGRRTKVWLNYGITTGEFTPDEARNALEELRAFAAKLEAVVDQADRIGRGDFAGDPEVAAADREAEIERCRRITEDRA